jgi:diguanylate cyclase
MSRYEIPITPKNYTVWYTYVSGENNELNGIIDEMIRNKDIFCDEIIEETRAIGNHGRSIQQKLRETSENLKELQKEFEEAKNAAMLDFLTGVPNRKALDDKFTEYISKAGPGDKYLCVLMIDIDHFKKFNNRYGHVTGDEVLKFAAKKIKEIIRGRDFSARFGGEEFAVLLPETSISGAKKVGEIIRRFFAEPPIKTRSESVKPGNTTVSIGAGCYRSGETLEELVSRSDKALYYAKNTGRNRVVTEFEITAN